MNAGLEDFLNKFSIENLKKICEAAGLPKTGTKDELIKRIINNKERFLEVFPALLNKTPLDYLKIIAKNLNLKVNSDDTKKSLILKIMRKIKRISNSETKSNDKKRSKAITEHDVKRVAKLLIKISDNLVRVKNEESLRDTIASILKSKKVKVIYEVQKEIEIIPGLSLPSRRDLIIEGIPVELKYVDDGRKLKNKIKEGLGQAVIYKKNLGKSILAIYDKSRTLPTKSIHKIEEGIYLVVL